MLLTCSEVEWRNAWAIAFQLSFGPRAFATAPPNGASSGRDSYTLLTYVHNRTEHYQRLNAFKMFALRNALPRAGARAFSTTTPRSLAKMQLIGRLADTPAVNPTSTGRDVIRYAVGVSTGSRDENGNRGVSWFKVASFSEGPQKDLLLSLPKG